MASAAERWDDANVRRGSLAKIAPHNCAHSIAQVAAPVCTVNVFVIPGGLAPTVPTIFAQKPARGGVLVNRMVSAHAKRDTQVQHASFFHHAQCMTVLDTEHVGYLRHKSHLVIAILDGQESVGKILLG